MRIPLAAFLCLAAVPALAGPIARIAPVSVPMSRPATVALQSFLRLDPSFASARGTQPGLAAVLNLSPDRARDRQALGPLAASLPLYYDANQLSLAMLTASAASQEEVASRVQRAVRAVDRGQMSRRALKSELDSLQAYSIYGEPAANVLGTARLASARLAAGERTRRVAAALMAGVRDDVAGHPDDAVYGEYGRPLPGAAPQDPRLAAETDARLLHLQTRLGDLGFPTTVLPEAREHILSKAREGRRPPFEAMREMLATAEERAVGALQARAYAPGTRFILAVGADGTLSLRMDELGERLTPGSDDSALERERASQRLLLAVESQVQGIRARAERDGHSVRVPYATRVWLAARFEAAPPGSRLGDFLASSLEAPLRRVVAALLLPSRIEVVLKEVDGVVGLRFDTEHLRGG